MSEQTVITVAYAYPLQASAVEQITEFKRTRPNVSIVLEDYSQYATVDNDLAGEEKPDIVITDPSHTLTNIVSDDTVSMQLYQNNLYVDLVPYLEKDDVLNFDNLFGCVRRLFDDGNSGMWGISTDIEFDLLLGSPALAGEYPEKGHWNLTEMLDCLDSPPENKEKIYGYTRHLYSILIAQGYGYFIDGSTCSFDSEEFVRYLEFMKNLPADYKTEWRQTSPVAYLLDLRFPERDQALTREIMSGRIVFDEGHITGVRGLLITLFPEENSLIPVGYATKNDSGCRVRADNTYIITTHAEDPGLCFELLKAFFGYGVEYTDKYSFGWPLFTRRDHFRTAIDECTEIFRDVRTPTPEEYAEICDLLDSMGSPIIEDTPEDVWNIVNEEMSAFFTGMGTAEECAKKIQSRVSIWLSEHE